MSVVSKELSLREFETGKSPAARGMIVHDQDNGPIASALARLYEVISFEEGAEPDWRGLRALFYEHARITRITPEGVDCMDLQRFVAMIRHLFEIGTYTGFYEFELARKVQRFGDIAQVWSYYETRRNQHAQRPLNRGVNSIQLIRSADSWRVLSLFWDEKHASASLDLRTVFPEGEQDAKA